MEQKIKFKDLSGSLKTIIVISWIIAILWAFTFLIGFGYGVAETIAY